MPAKFQMIYEDWAQFDQAITRFKNNIKEGWKRTYNISIWMGSEKQAEKIIVACTLDWKEERPNGGFVKFTYRRVQSLHMAHNLILVRVPMDTCANTLQKVLTVIIEKGRQKMVKCNTQKYALIDKVPQFVLERDY
jgi:hypothetical protein